MGASTVVVEEEMMADLPVLPAGSQRLTTLHPSANLDAKGF